MNKKIRLAKNYKPSLKEKYMNPKQREYFRLKLTHWRQLLLDESQEVMENMSGDNSHDVADEADRATRESEIAFGLLTRDRHRKLLAHIDAALRRIENETYGYCEETGEPIGIARLDARPIATLSIEAQEHKERQEAQYNNVYG